MSASLRRPRVTAVMKTANRHRVKTRGRSNDGNGQGGGKRRCRRWETSKRDEPRLRARGPNSGIGDKRGIHE